MKKILFMVFFTYLFSAEIFVAVSSNLTYVMPEIIKNFNDRYPKIKVRYILSSSGKLTAQILRGAPYDMFLAADMKYPLFLYSRGIGVLKPEVYAKGGIVLFSLKYKNLSLENLKNYNSIVISKPKTTPYGRAALMALKNKGIYSLVKNKLIFSESIASVLSYVKNGADVGIISKSLIFSKNIENLGKFYYKDINNLLYPPITQGVLLISKNNDAKKFYNFLFSNECKKILKEYGYE